jgi:peptidoglycan/LPS O-acetylase OafA/YrhL
MKRFGVKGHDGRGWLAAGIAGLSLGMAGVMAFKTSGNWQLAMAGAAVVSAVCAFLGARMQARQNRAISWPSLVLVVAMATLAVLALSRQGFEWPPSAVVAQVAITALATVAVHVQASRSSTRRNSGGRR